MEHKCIIQIEVSASADFSHGNARIASSQAPLRPEMLCIAVEHLMTFVASQSKVGFDKALDLLVEAVKKNRVERALSGGSA